MQKVHRVPTSFASSRRPESLTQEVLLSLQRHNLDGYLRKPVPRPQELRDVH